MLKIVHGKTFELQDVEHFIDLLNGLNQQPLKQAQSFFASDEKITVSRAPGRLDVMGGIADYSGSLVLQLPIKEATFAAVQPGLDNRIRIISLSKDDPSGDRCFEMGLEDFIVNDKPVDYKSAQLYFSSNGSTGWAAYIAGVFLVLMKEKSTEFQGGANILIYSDVPEGKGVSSSAALEVASMTAVAKAFQIQIDPVELAALCQKVENLIVGAPCGIMDQMTSVLGKERQLMALLCQPALLQPFIQVPDQIAFWGIDSGIRHSVSGSDYTSVRVGAFMGQRIILEYMKKENFPIISGDYLANITPDNFQRYFVNHLPSKMNGSEFIQRYQGTFDPVTEVDLELEYNILNPTAHPIYENHRVNAFAELLKTQITEEACTRLGELMYSSHKSYSACGLNSSGTDRLVELTQQIGQKRGLYGAKITGGGSGGTVAVLGRNNAGDLIEQIIESYTKETGHKSYLFTGSSMGADEFGTILLKIIDHS
jgi:galactokinase